MGRKAKSTKSAFSYFRLVYPETISVFIKALLVGALLGNLALATDLGLGTPGNREGNGKKLEIRGAGIPR